MVKSEVTMPAKARRRYTEEFKMEAVRLVRESAHPVAQVARDLGIPDNVLGIKRCQEPLFELTAVNSGE
jgi:transposase